MTDVNRRWYHRWFTLRRYWKRQLDFTGGRVKGVVDTGTGADSVVLGDTGNDAVTITGALTDTTIQAGTGADSIVVQSNVSAGLISLDAGADTLNFTASSVGLLDNH